MRLLQLLFLFIISFVFYACGKSDGVAPSLAPPESPAAPVAPPAVTPLTISPVSLDVIVNSSTVLTASGGSGSYNFTIFSGTGSVTAVTGNYLAPSVPGSAVVRVTDSSGQFADAVMTVHASLQIAPLNPAIALGGTQSFSGTGGVNPLVFSVVSGTGSIDSSSGLFTSGGAGSSTVRVMDSQGHHADTVISVFAGLGISPVSPTLSINATASFSAAGGSAPFVYSVLSGGGSINSATGSYAAPSSPGAVVVRVTDSLGQHADANVTVINAAPAISALPDQVTNEDGSVSFGFTVTDVDSALSCASVTKSSSNLTLLPLSGMAVSGTAPNCLATLTPAANQFGTTHVTLGISDGFSADSKSFDFTVNAQNDAPVIGPISAQSTNEDTPLTVNFTVSDVDDSLTCAGSLSASSSGPGVVPPSNIVFSGTAPNCSAVITPVADQNGSLNLTFRVSDPHGLFADRTFAVAVNAVNDAPVISAIGAQSVKSDGSIVVNYTMSDVDSSLNCATSVNLTSSNAAVLPVADIVKSGTAPNCALTISPSLNAAGSSSIGVTVSDSVLTAVSNFNLSVVNVSSVAVTPASLSLAVSGVSQLAAVVQYSDSSSAVKTSSSTWSSSAPGVATVSGGQVTGVASGTANISAVYKGVTSGASAVSVTSVTSLSVSNGAVTGGIGSQASISATAQNSTTSFDVTASGVWSTSNAAVATVNNGVISYLAAGNAVITVTYAGLTANVSVTVSGKSLVSIAIGGGTSLPLNGTKNFTATATYSDASTEDVTKAAVWTSSNSSVAAVSNSIPNVGRVTGLAAGTSTLTASVGAVSGNLLVTVNSVTLSSIAVTPYDAIVTSNASYSLRATGTYSDASTADITDLVTWSSSNTSAATISNLAGSRGVATTPSFAGYLSTTVTATLGAVSGSTPFGVNGASISSILVTPTVTLTPNQTYALKAYANLTDGGLVDLTEFAVWSSSSAGSVSVSNSAGSRGTVTGVANGSAVITALFNGVSGTRTISVSGSSSVTETGTGLLGMYYIWTGGTPPTSPFLAANKRGQRIDSQVNFAWASGNAPMGVGDMFAVRWTGFYKATSATNYFCTNSDDGVRVWINGVQVINNWTEHGPAWDCSSNVALTAGTKYSVVVEYYENGGGSEAHLTRSSVSAADGQNLARAIPQADLYPQ